MWLPALLRLSVWEQLEGDVDNKQSNRWLRFGHVPNSRPLTFQRSKPRSIYQLHCSTVSELQTGRIISTLSQSLDVCDIPSYSSLYLKADTQVRRIFTDGNLARGFPALGLVWQVTRCHQQAQQHGAMRLAFGIVSIYHTNERNWHAQNGLHLNTHTPRPVTGPRIWTGNPPVT